MNRKTKYEKRPYIRVSHQNTACHVGWDNLCEDLYNRLQSSSNPLVTIDCYPGVNETEIENAIARTFGKIEIVHTRDLLKDESTIDLMVSPFLGGDDPIFGCISHLSMIDFFETGGLESTRLSLKSREIETAYGKHKYAANRAKTPPVFVIGIGAALVTSDLPSLIIYADLPRWESQLRMRRDEYANVGTSDCSIKWTLQYKRAYFVDWRVADKHKRKTIDSWDYLLDTTIPDEPRLVTGETIRTGLRLAAARPFRLVPFFDPAPWGGQWMKETCGLDPNERNYGWCFDCVPEENSLLLRFGDTDVEIPALNLVLYQPRQLLGDAIRARFGDEFPIRFDLLDTIGGGNLSLQVHPLTDYVYRNFGMHYTQDESYYILDADETATVYLGLQNETQPEEVVSALKSAQSSEGSFDDTRLVNRWPARKHDHFLIPAGTVHCSGKGAVVLEISATPYIFTLKLWDWGRVGLDGLPRPINIERGVQNIQWERNTKWVQENLINRVKEVDCSEDWREEQTGLHELQFIETRRHWFTGPVLHNTSGTVHVLNLVAGDEIIVESQTEAFEPFIVHYAETFIVPASVGEYIIRPHGNASCQKYATIKAFVRT